MRSRTFLFSISFVPISPSIRNFAASLTFQASFVRTFKSRAAGATGKSTLVDNQGLWLIFPISRKARYLGRQGYNSRGSQIQNPSENGEAYIVTHQVHCKIHCGIRGYDPILPGMNSWTTRCASLLCTQFWAKKQRREPGAWKDTRISFQSARSRALVAKWSPTEENSLIGRSCPLFNNRMPFDRVILRYLLHFNQGKPLNCSFFQSWFGNTSVVVKRHALSTCTIASCHIHSNFISWTTDFNVNCLFLHFRLRTMGSFSAKRRGE